MAALPSPGDHDNFQTFSHGVSEEDCSVLHGCNCKDKNDRSSIMISLLNNSSYQDMVIIETFLPSFKASFIMLKKSWL